MAVMATPQRPRVYFDADEETKLAIRLAAVQRGFDTESALLKQIVREQLQEEIAQARKILQQKKKREKNE